MSLHKRDWAKIIGGLVLAVTGAGAARIGPMAGLFASGATAGAGAGAGTLAGMGGETAGAGLTTALGTGGMTGVGEGLGGAGALSGFSSLVGPSTAMGGLKEMGSGAMGTPTQKMTQVGPPPPMPQQSDPFDILKQIQSMKQGGM